MSPPVITDVNVWGDPVHESSVVKAPVGAGRATPPGRSIKRRLQLRYADLACSEERGKVVAEPVQKWRRLEPARKRLSQALAGATGVRTTARGERIGRVNWGPSEVGGPVPQPGGIRHKPPGGSPRRRCGHRKQRSGRTIQPVGEPRATGLVVQVRSAQFRLDASPTTEIKLRTEIRTVTAYKRVLGNSVEAIDWQFFILKKMEWRREDGRKPIFWVGLRPWIPNSRKLEPRNFSR